MIHLFVINPKSFKYKINKIATLISQHITPEKDAIYISRYPRSAVGYVRKFVKKANDIVRVYAVGGDGILFDCLNGVAKLPNAQLAHIPYGTQNDFIRSFGEGQNIKFRDINNQMNSPVVDTDIMYCGSNYALNFCSIGAESAAVNVGNKIIDTLKHYPKKITGMLFTVAGAFALMNRSLTSQKYNVVIDGKTFDGNYATIVIANGSCYGGNLSAAPNALPNDNFLDIMLFKAAPTFRIMSAMPDYIHGKYFKYPKMITHHFAKEISVSSNRVMNLCLDGEQFFDTKFAVSVVPDAVKIVSATHQGYRTIRDTTNFSL